MIIYLRAEDVLELHDNALKEFGGTPGVLDRGALASLVAQPAMQAFDVELYETTIEKAAAYLFFISRNHVFVDGNKRTAYASAYTFLLMNGLVLSGADEDVFELVLNTAQGRFSDPRAVADELARLVTVL